MLAAILICGSSLLLSCTADYGDNPIQPEPQEYKGIPLVILDTDIGSSTDDLFAMEMLYRYADQGRCKLLGIVVDRQGDDYPVLIDVMNTYFGYGDVPIGVERNGVKSPEVFIDYRNLYNHKTDKGELMFKTSVSDYSALPDGWQLYRRLLATQLDHSVSIVCTGFVTCLAQLLQSGGDEYSPLNGVELVRRKVKCIYMQGGVFGEAEEPDFNFAQGADFAQEFFRLWPTEVDMVFSPMEAGQTVDYKPEQVIGDISWTDIHPIKQVYMNCGCDTGQRMWDVLPTIQAVEGDDLFTRHSDRYPRMCHYLYTLTYRTFSLPVNLQRHLVCRHTGENQIIQ